MRFGPNPLPSIPEPNPDDMAIMRSLLLPMAAFGMKSFAKCSYDVIFRMWVSAPACEWLCHPAGAAAPFSAARMCRKWVETGRKPIRSWNVMFPPPAPGPVAELYTNSIYEPWTRFGIFGREGDKHSGECEAARALLAMTGGADHGGAGCLEAGHRRPLRAIAVAAAAAAGLAAAFVLAQTDAAVGARTSLLPRGQGFPISLDTTEAEPFSWSAAARFRVRAGVELDKADLPSDLASAMNFSVNPCENFYEYTCGTWLSESVIPPDRTRNAKSWDDAKRRVNDKLLSLVTKEWPPDSPYRKLNYWYNSCMNLEIVNALGAAPLQPMLDRIEAISTLQDLQDYLVEVVPLVHHSLEKSLYIDVL
jgi:hypothetical protein